MIANWLLVEKRNSKATRPESAKKFSNLMLDAFSAHRCTSSMRKAPTKTPPPGDVLMQALTPKSAASLGGSQIKLRVFLTLARVIVRAAPGSVWGRAKVRVSRDADR